MSNNENFRNVIDISEGKEKKHTVKNSIVVPFLSGVLGCGLVIGTCFGVPEFRDKILGNTRTTTTSVSNSSVANTGAVDLVSLKSYSDTSVYSANKILPSIVGIEIKYNVTTNSMFSIFGGLSAPSTSEGKAAGSGIIISEDGYILTNNHVVDSSSSNTFYTISDATSVKVKLSDGKEYDAKIIGKDEQTDLAILKIEAENLTAAEFADSDSIKIGEFAMAVGNPLSLGTTITCGVVSALNREITDSTDNRKYTCIQTDAPINSGNSGGALVNSEGKVIGVNTLKLASTGVEGIGFAIPINSTKSIIEDLIKYNKVRRPYIGIDARTLDEETAKRNNLVPGVYIVSVVEFSAAETAGLKAGDVITAVDGTEVKTRDELDKIKFTHSIGDKITLSVNRKGEKKEITVTLQESK